MLLIHEVPPGRLSRRVHERNQQGEQNAEDDNHHQFYLLGFLLAAQGITKDRDHLWAAASGLALGLAFSLKPVALAAEAGILMMIFFTYRSRLAPIALSLFVFAVADSLS